MSTSIAQRLVGGAVCFLVTTSLACREDPELPSAGATGGSPGAGGRGGTGGSGARDGSAPSATGGTSGAGDAASPTPDTSASADARAVTDGAPGDGQAVGGDGAPTDASTSGLGRPFTSHPMTYPAGTIRPSICVAPGTDGGAPGSVACTQPALDQAVAAFYDKWKAAYLRNITTGACSGLSYIVAVPPTDFPGQVAVSELQGMGMLITVVMAGHDQGAREAYDALLRYARKYRSNRNPVLMARQVPSACPMTLAANIAESQTDGDLDMALSLLMADRQWGSAGAINYLQEARNMIGVIKTADMTMRGLPVLGDWVATGQIVDGGVPADPKFSVGLRTSDLMPGHFRAFGAVTMDDFWMRAIDASHSVISAFQASHSVTTGLVPDYIVNVTTAPAPAPEDWSTVDKPNDGDYFYEAARVPLRLASDFISSTGEVAARSKALVVKINDWISGARTMGNPALIRDGYELDGSNLGNSGSPLFEGTFGAAAIVDVKYQAWLDAIWGRVSTGNVSSPADSHTDSVRLLSLIVMSGNWWVP
jgi:endoglucanase